MKLSTIILLVSFLDVSATTFSQKKITVELKNTTIKQVFAEIEKKSDFKFVYRNDLINVNREVTISANNEPVETVLVKLFESSDLTFKVFEGNLIVVTSKAMLQTKVTGKVTDAGTGEVLPGVSISIEGTSSGTITDTQGKYSLEIPQENAVLVFSFIGYLTEKIPFTGQSALDVKLVQNITNLNEVVVIGYGTTTRKNFTGSVTKVGVDNSPLALVPHTDALDVLRGTVPGITVSQEQGAGQTPRILIRGQKSVSDFTNPLIVLDGIIFQGSMRDIDPSTIESFDILKDATAVASYGSRAANGVIMITTKKGKLGKPVINFRSTLGISNVINKADVLSPEKWINKVNLLQGLDKDADPTTWMKDFEKVNYQNGKTTNWQDISEQTGHTQNYSLSLSGATERTNYFFSGSYAKTEGVLIGDDYNRTSLTTRLTTDITKWLEFGGDVNFGFNDYSGPTNYDIYQAIRMTPYGKVYRDEEKKLLEKYPATEGIYRVNPLWNIQSGTVEDHDVYYTTILEGHTKIKCPWIEGLSYRLNYSYTNHLVERDNFNHEGFYVTEGTSDSRYSTAALSSLLAQATGYSERSKDIGWVWDNIINYTHSFGKHFIDITGVYTRDSYDNNYKKLTGTNFTGLGNTELGYDGIPYAATQVSLYKDTLRTNIGYLGRLIYSYNNKYHLTASIRRDGASSFGEGKKWGTFPAIGVAWTVSQEEFMKSITPISYLKVKFSWGQNGNHSMPPYYTLSTLSLGQTGNYSYPFGNTSKVSWGQRINALGNPNLGWETTTAFNTGFELSLFKDRITLNVDAYQSKTTDQDFKRKIPVMASGITEIWASMGEVDNWGTEITLSTVNLKFKDFEWNSSLLYYMNRNKLKDLYGDGKDDIANNLFLNKSLGVIYGYKPIGIIQAEEADPAKGLKAGDVKFWDKDGNGSITTDDRTILGYKTENFRMSFSNTLRFKNFELYALFTGIFGGNDWYKAVNIYAYRTASDVTWDNNFNHDWWTSENRSNKYPGVSYSDSRYTPLQNRTFVRLQNLSLSYTFHQPWVKKLNINNFRVFAAATNLFTLTGWEGGDPETGQTLGSGYNYGYPLSNVYSMGVDLTF